MQYQLTFSDLWNCAFSFDSFLAFSFWEKLEELFLQTPSFFSVVRYKIFHFWMKKKMSIVFGIVKVRFKNRISWSKARLLSLFASKEQLGPKSAARILRTGRQNVRHAQKKLISPMLKNLSDVLGVLTPGTNMRNCCEVDNSPKKHWTQYTMNTTDHVEAGISRMRSLLLYNFPTFSEQREHSFMITIRFPRTKITDHWWKVFSPKFCVLVFPATAYAIRLTLPPDDVASKLHGTS